MADQEQQNLEPRPTQQLPDQTAPTPVTDRLRRGLSQVTRPVQRAEPAPRQQVSSAIRERIVALVAALDDQQHPLHQQSVNELVAIGDPAVPLLNDALNPRRSWLAAYRATEALGQIGDGRATGPLIEALRHPNSNVRWGAVRVLAALGDARALLELRRVARDDRGKTSWGEPVAGAAQSAMEQMRSQNVILRGAELIKTAISCVLMLVALILAWSIVGSLRGELADVGRVPVTPLTLPAPTPAPTSEVTPEPTIDAAATVITPTTTLSAAITGRVLSPANVRAEPSGNATKLGTVTEGDDIIFLASNAERTWFRIRLGERKAASTSIAGEDATGWVIGTSVSPPQGELPVE